MRPFLLVPLLVLPLLAGCASLNHDAYMTNAECRRQVDRDPDVRAIMAKQAGGYRPIWGEPTLDDVKQNVYIHCMRVRGLMPQGGVEPVKRSRY